MFFVTSEQFTTHDYAADRRYTVRRFRPDQCGRDPRTRGRIIEDAGTFQQYASAAAARRAAAKLARGGK